MQKQKLAHMPPINRADVKKKLSIRWTNSHVVFVKFLASILLLLLFMKGILLHASGLILLYTSFYMTGTV